MNPLTLSPYNSASSLNKDSNPSDTETPNTTNTIVSTVSESLLDILNDFGSLPEFISRCIFQEIVQVVSALHSQNSYHGNLTIETIFLNPNNKIVLADSILQEQEFTYGALADMFCLGEILFAMVAGFLPFASEDEVNSLSPPDIDWEAFWLSNEKRIEKMQNKGAFFNPDFRDIVTCLLSMKFEPESLAMQINEHPWMKGAGIGLKSIRELLIEARKKMKKYIN